MTVRINDLYSPSQEESSRQAFVGALKTVVNGVLEKDLSTRYESHLRTDYEKRHGKSPSDREEALETFKSDQIYQLWSSLGYSSQNLLWETCGETVDRLEAEFESRASDIIEDETTRGTINLTPDLDLPLPIGKTEIHRQPGGYFYGQSEAKLTAALLYMGSVEIYRKAKGFGTNEKPGSTDVGHQFAQLITARHPNLKPKRILDIGCGVGHMAMGLKQFWPEAEVFGVDLSAPFLRFAHLWSSDLELDVHWHQLDAADTSFESGSFDLIVSQILFHETSDDKLQEIMAEAQRLLAPGGVFFNVDVPYQPNKLTVPALATHAWQLNYNGEPYWTGFADIDVANELKTAGFDEDDIFHVYQPVGGGREYFIFGACKSS